MQVLIGGETQVQLLSDPELAAKAEGQSLAINVDHVDLLYAIHRRNGADIQLPLETKPWGMAEYTVRDNNGYRIRFGAPSSYRGKSADRLPETITIVSRLPGIRKSICC